jgi:hypothetical protein
MIDTLMIAILIGEAVGLLVGVATAVAMYRRWVRERSKAGIRG